jgi:hypothetical protein
LIVILHLLATKVKMTNKLLLLEKIKMVLKLMAPLLMTELNRKKITILNNNKMDRMDNVG